jgi:3(or 17)beta-hydroxysteroid dehydrogenase
VDRVKDKVAIVTGGGGGLGKATAMLLAKEGAVVVVTDLDESAAESTANEIRARGSATLSLKHDVTSETEWNSVIQRTREEFGKLDVLVNNAGVIFYKKITDTSLAEWRRLMSVNLDGVFLGTKCAIEAMKKDGGGSIINISSVAGLCSLSCE